MTNRTFADLLASVDIKELWYIIGLRHKLPPIRAERLFKAYSEARSEMIALSNTPDSRGVLHCDLVVDESDGGAPDVYFDCTISSPDDNQKYAFEFTDWSELVGCEVDCDCLQKYGALVVTAELLWEMTFCGFDTETVRGAAKQLKDSIDVLEFDGGERVGRPVDDLLAELDVKHGEYKNSPEEQAAKDWFIYSSSSVKARIFEKLKADVLYEAGDDISDAAFTEIVRARLAESTYKYKGCDTAEELICAMLNGLDYDDIAYLAELLL